MVVSKYISKLLCSLGVVPSYTNTSFRTRVECELVFDPLDLAYDVYESRKDIKGLSLSEIKDIDIIAHRTYRNAIYGLFQSPVLERRVDNKIGEGIAISRNVESFKLSDEELTLIRSQVARHTPIVRPTPRSTHPSSSVNMALYFACHDSIHGNK